MVKRRYIAVLLLAAALTASAGALSANALRGGWSSATTSQAAAVAPATAEELGKLLFFDNRLSGDTSISCSSCHSPENAWADGLSLSAGYRSTLYFRNTPTIVNAGRMPLLDWDGRFAGDDMDSLVRDHLAEGHFMNVDGRLLVERLRQVPVYEVAFQEIFGGDVSYGKTLRALTSFVNTLNSENHPYLRYLEGDQSALDDRAREGLELFEGRAGCAQCHSGELLSDGEMHALGVPENGDIFNEPLRHITFRRYFRLLGVAEYVSMRADPGLYALTTNEADRGKFRTPSLLEAADTAPYMHNGVLATLEDVARFYNQGAGRGDEGKNFDPRLEPLGFTEEEIASLVAFLSTLRSEREPFDTPDLPAYELRILGQN